MRTSLLLAILLTTCRAAVVSNGKLQLHLNPNLTVAVDDLAAGLSWGADPIGTLGWKIPLADFRARLGPVRIDRDPGAQLSLVLEVLLAKDRPAVSFRIQRMEKLQRRLAFDQLVNQTRVVPVGPAIRETVRNEKVSVKDVVLQPGETETITANHPSATVYFETASFEVTPAGGKTARVSVARGETKFLAGEPRAIRNSGTAPLHYVRVDFLGSGGDVTWGRTGLSPHYKMILENRFARIYDIRIAAHTNEPLHTHKDRVVICLSGAKLKHLYPDGHEEPSTLKAGESAWRHGGTHIGQNLGDTNLWVIAIEPK